MADSYWQGGTGPADVFGNYNTLANWSAGIPGASAVFTTGSFTRWQVGFSANTTAGSWTFQGSQQFVVTPTSFDVTFTGAGIQSLGAIPIISTPSSLTFTNSSSAGFSSITGETGSDISFYNSSNAGSGALVIKGTLDFYSFSNAGSSTITSDSFAYFRGNSHAATSHITVNNYLGFLDDSSASTSHITIKPGLVRTAFFDRSTAQSATITNDGQLSFLENSTAGDSSLANDGLVSFSEDASAGTSDITNSGDIGFGASSDAGTATVLNNDYIEFFETAGAGGSTITNNSDLLFVGSSSAERATIANNGSLRFEGLSRAGTAAITNEGTLTFTGTSAANSSSAESARIENHNSLIFDAYASAGNATIHNSMDSGYPWGVLTFRGHSTAGNATITLEDAPPPGSGGIGYEGGELYFEDDSNGGTARIINGGQVHFRPDYATTSMSVGSISGSGVVVIDRGRISIGTNNLSTVVTGDVTSGTESAVLIKVGSGTLSLAGLVSVSGGVVVSAGTLRADGTMNGPVTVNGGTLGGNGTVAGNVTVNTGGTLGGGGTIAGTVIVNSGGTLAPGASAGLLKTGSVNLLTGSSFAFELGGTAAGTGYDELSVAGTVTLGAATLTSRLINGFQPSTTVRQQYVIIENDGTDAIAGSFINLNEGATFLVGDRYFTITYAGGTGNDVVITNSGAYRVGTERNDVLGATAFFDTLDGRGGLDVADYSFMTSALKVTLKSGTQTVAGDTLISIEGLFGGTKADTFTGTTKANFFRGGGGKDKLDGKGGSDTADYADKTKAIAVKLDGANEVTVKVKGRAEDILKNIENVTGGSKADKLSGDSKANIFDGRLGKDTLTGAGGSDKFVFSTALSTSNIDTITDFRHGTDKIRLDDAIFAAIGVKLDGTEFYAKSGAVKAHDANDRIIYDTTSGKLYYDDDGKGGHAAIQFATLSGHPALSYGDFSIV